MNMRDKVLGPILFEKRKCFKLLFATDSHAYLILIP